jgi:hypothetical protein
MAEMRVEANKRIQGFETELPICSVVRNKARVERARNFVTVQAVRLGNSVAARR